MGKMIGPGALIGLMPLMLGGAETAVTQDKGADLTHYYSERFVSTSACTVIEIPVECWQVLVRDHPEKTSHNLIAENAQSLLTVTLARHAARRVEEKKYKRAHPAQSGTESLKLPT